MKPQPNLLFPWIPCGPVHHLILCVHVLLLFVTPVLSRADGRTDITSVTNLQGKTGAANQKEGRGKMRDNLQEIQALVEALQRQVTNLKKSQVRDR